MKKLILSSILVTISFNSIQSMNSTQDKKSYSRNKNIKKLASTKSKTNITNKRPVMIGLAVSKQNNKTESGYRYPYPAFRASQNPNDFPKKPTRKITTSPSPARVHKSCHNLLKLSFLNNTDKAFTLKSNGKEMAYLESQTGYFFPLSWNKASSTLEYVLERNGLSPLLYSIILKKNTNHASLLIKENEDQGSFNDLSSAPLFTFSRINFSTDQKIMLEIQVNSQDIEVTFWPISS